MGAGGVPLERGAAPAGPRLAVGPSRLKCPLADQDLELSERICGSWLIDHDAPSFGFVSLIQRTATADSTCSSEDFLRELSIPAIAFVVRVHVRVSTPRCD